MEEHEKLKKLFEIDFSVSINKDDPNFLAEKKRRLSEFKKLVSGLDDDSEFLGLFVVRKEITSKLQAFSNLSPVNAIEACIEAMESLDKIIENQINTLKGVKK